MTFYKFARSLIMGFYKLFYRIHVYGEENIPEDGAVVIAPNHTSAADPIIIGVSAKRQIHFVAKAELFKIPVAGAVIRALGAIPVHRSEGDVAALKKSLNVLEEGKMLCVFPQGTRCPGETVKDTADRLKSGVGLMAMRSGAPVVPVCIRTKKHKTSMFRRTDVVFGRLITREELAAFEGRTKYNDAARLIFDRICEIDESPLPGVQENSTCR